MFNPSSDSFTSDNLENQYNSCYPINPCSNIYDLEIYNKKIDSLSSPIQSRNNYPLPSFPTMDAYSSPNCKTDINYHTIRYIVDDGELPPSSERILNDLSIKCRNLEFGDDNTYSNVPYSTEYYQLDPNKYGSNSYGYNIGCISSPNITDNEINMTIY